MRIAVPYSNGKISPHMGSANFFKFYNIENNQIERAFTLASGVEGEEANAKFLRMAGAQLVICGGLGGSMIKALYAQGIMVMGGILGNADEKIEEFLNGTIAYQPIDPKKTDSGCGHHGEGGCGHHHHGEGSCEHLGEEGCEFDGDDSGHGH